jgi:hypothetical protein
MRRCPSSELGSYVLELAGVLMGITVFIVGAADVTRIFQARSAVRAGVHDGARCIFPTDAACVARGHGALSPPSRTFDVWVWGTGYEVPQESFVVSAQWRQEPVYDVPLLRDEITDVTVERSQFQYRPYSLRYPMTAHTTYLMQTRFLPVVVGGRPLEPVFADPFTHRVSRPSATYGLTNVSGSTTRRVTSALKTPYNESFKIGSISFPIKDAWPTMDADQAQVAEMPESFRDSLPCLFGERRGARTDGVLDWSAAQPQECRYRVRSSDSSRVMERGALKVPMMFRVEGDSRGTVEGAEGKVMLALSWRSPSMGEGQVELGGRRLGHWGGGNFVPRGLAEMDINSGLRSQYADYTEELRLYRELPLLPVDATVRLDFYVVSFNDRRVAWNGNKIEVWLPQYRLVHEQNDCGYTPDPLVCALPPQHAPVHYLSFTDGASFSAVVDGRDTCSIDEAPSAERDLSATIARIREEALRTGAARPYSFQLRVPTAQGVCAPQISTVSCAVELPEYFEGCAVPVTLDAISARCGLSAESNKVLEYRKRSIVRSLRRVRACSDEALPQCALSNARRVGSEVYGDDTLCGAATMSTSPQMIVGPLDGTTCQDRQGDVRRLYRSRENIPADAPISVVRLPASPRFSSEPPVSSCVPYLSAEGASRELLCGRGLSEVAAERCCAESAGRCRKQSVVAPSDPLDGTERLSVLSAAKRRVVEGVQAGYPPVRYQEVCGESELNCLQVTAAVDASESKAIVSAKVRVPLMLFRLFEKNWVSVEHSTERLLETS